MIKVVNIILICQIKVGLLPQLIPLYWIISVLIVFFVFNILFFIYFYKKKDIIYIYINVFKVDIIGYLW